MSCVRRPGVRIPSRIVVNASLVAYTQAGINNAVLGIDTRVKADRSHTA